MSRGFSRSSRAAHADRVLRAEDPRREGRALAQEIGVDFGVLWSWVLKEAEERARAALDPFPSLRELCDEETRRRFLEILEADRTLKARHLADQHFRRCPASPEDLRALFASLPGDRSQDWEFDTLVARPEMPEDLLLDLLRQKRFMGMLAHRSGPRELLEGVLAEERTCSEAALTLLYAYYSREDVPAADFERLLRESWPMEIVRKWAREEHAFEPDKMDVLRRVVAEGWQEGS